MIIRMLKSAVLFGIIAFLVGGSVYLTLTMMIKSEETVVVPDLVRKDLLYALKILTDLDLNAKIKAAEYSSDIPENHIIFQDPEPGAEIKKDRDVKLIISKGTQTLSMPSLQRLSIQQARILLEENDLCPGTTSFTHSPTARKDEVIAQWPNPGATVQRGTCADLLISMGEMPIAYQMPDLTGKPLASALSLIERHRLSLGEIKSVIQPKVPLDTVAEQSPPRGYRISSGQAVNISINRKTDGRKISAISGVHLFRHQVASGFLRKHIRIRLVAFGLDTDIFDNLVKPGKEIWAAVPSHIDATLFLYEDESLVHTKLFDAW